MTDGGERDSDEALVAAYVSGDQAAFDRLVERHERRVYGICYRYFGNAADAEDALQDTFVALLRRADTYRATAAFSTWLYRVAMNACNDLSRKRRRRPQTVPLRAAQDGNPGADSEPRTDDPAVEEMLANRELGMDLLAALRQLEAAQREAVVLHDVYGVAYDEIAQRSGVAVGTVKSRIHRAHARLAAILEGSGAFSEPARANRPPTSQP